MNDPGNKISNFTEADLDRLFAGLKADREYSPRPGFYARVMDAVESSKGNSIWAAFLEPWFGRRLTVASAVLMLVMGVALIYPGTEHEREEEAAASPQLVAQHVAFASEAGQMAGPDAVLVNLVTYQEH
jgi:hypothetical protein